MWPLWSEILAVKFCIVQSRNLQCIFSRSFGLYRTDDIRRMMQISGSMDLVKSGAPVINDMRFVDFNVPVSEVMAIKDVPHDTIDATVRRRVAFVAGSAFGHSMLRVLATMREHDVQTTDVFYDFPPAFRWIERPALGDALPHNIECLLDELQCTGEQEFGQLPCRHEARLTRSGGAFPRRFPQGRPLRPFETLRSRSRRLGCSVRHSAGSRRYRA